MNEQIKSTYFFVENLSKHWPMQTVNISLNLTQGESLVLLGRSGCGKSTVLRMIAGLLSPDSGRIVLDGIDITSFPPGKRGVGMVFQDSALFPHLTVEDNIGYGLVSSGMSKKQSRKSAHEWLERFSLTGFARRKSETLSGGERQRVALARTLAVQPRLVLFDEPLSALDSDLRFRLRRELRERQQEQGYTAIYVTHDMTDAEVLADQIVKMTS
ncbi:MAG TPA: ABC transporter ATP-binding protein [Treponema sp.]|nr:ABC transporter ATP-binding protein [Treponema sp.]